MEGGSRSLSPRAISIAKLLRPQFLIAGLSLNALGIAVAMFAGSSFDFEKALVFQLIVTSLQLAGATANEYADVESDRLNKNRTWFSGGSGVIASGELSRSFALEAALAFSLAALLLGVFLVTAMGVSLLVLALVALGLVLALSYSLKPLRFAYNGAGEVSMAVMVSLLVPVSSFLVQHGSIDRVVVLASAPLVFQMLSLMMVVQYPDYEADLETGKRNMVVRLGRHRAWRMGILMLLVGAAASFLGGLTGLPGLAAGAVGTALVIEALLFASIERKLESRRVVFWSTAATCGFYVLAIGAMAALIASA